MISIDRLKEMAIEDIENNINPCNTCDVEPPAMKFKCPECEHNPEKKQVMDKDLCPFDEDIARGVVNNLFKQLDQLKAEKLDLIDKVMVYKAIVDETTPQRYLKLKQTLTEIKEIAEKACECCGECQTEFSTKDYCDFNVILQKISEVDNVQSGEENNIKNSL